MVSKRLQVVMSESELKGYERIARAKGMALSAWVRQTLRAERQNEPGTSPERKLVAIRAAAQHRFPAPDVDQMLAEIARGYRQDLAD
jgi:hypothetical protein